MATGRGVEGGVGGVVTEAGLALLAHQPRVLHMMAKPLATTSDAGVRHPKALGGALAPVLPGSIYRPQHDPKFRAWYQDNAGKVALRPINGSIAPQLTSGKSESTEDQTCHAVLGSLRDLHTTSVSTSVDVCS